MLDEPQEIKVDAQWYRLVSSNPALALEPAVLVLPVPGGMLYRVVVPGNPVVFVPNVRLSELEGGP
jgi:hypothetical protein